MKRIICWFLGHQLKYEARVAENVMRFTCTRCGQRLLSINEKMAPWSEKLEQAYTEAKQ